MASSVTTLPPLDKLTPEAARGWVEAALTRETALRGHDEQLYPPAEDEAGLARARRLRESWRCWTQEAEAILGQVGEAVPVELKQELSRRVGRAWAMLGVTPETVNERRVQAARGEVRTAEEARRELRPEDRG